ncbi:MAG TPA: alpha/beta fold hydrolase [Candidatus Dormibacteraeota bacterium]
MAVQVLFVQGAGANAHEDFDRKLVTRLERALGGDYLVRYPRMPEEGDPRYATWKAALLGELDSLTDGAILVGHSVGGTILLHVLAEDPRGFKPGALMLIAAPFIGSGGWPSDEIQPGMDFAEHLPAALPVFLYHGTDDETVPTSHVHLYSRAIPQASVRILTHRDHQLNNDLGEIVRDIRSLAAP